MTTVGSVRRIRLFPVKSTLADDVPAAFVDTAGLRGDRSWGVVAADGSALSAREAPMLRSVTSSLDGDRLLLDVPGHGTGLAGKAADDALSDLIGRPISLAPASAPLLDAFPVHVVAEQAIADALAKGRQLDAACDIEDPRANLHLDLSGPGDVPEPADWVGRQVRVGGALLRVVREPKHCLGLYAEVLSAGPVNAGDPVELLD